MHGVPPFFACGSMACIHPYLSERTDMNHIDADTEQAVRRFLGLIAVDYSTAGAILFGSRARGTHRPDSDADVAVLLNGAHQRFLPTKLAMADVAFDVLLETGINISPLPVWLDEWNDPENYANPALLQNIAHDGVRM
jgi:predicted nucleotidyltransferase